MLYLAKFTLHSYYPFKPSEKSLEFRLVEADNIGEVENKIDQNFSSTTTSDEKQIFVEDLEVTEIIR